jgi:hypothetical protein
VAHPVAAKKSFESDVVLFDVFGTTISLLMSKIKEAGVSRSGHLMIVCPLCNGAYFYQYLKIICLFTYVIVTRVCFLCLFTLRSKTLALTVGVGGFNKRKQHDFNTYMSIYYRPPTASSVTNP